jgi:dTDP-4-amino-4,6-dideoxygalactose transaminase
MVDLVSQYTTIKPQIDEAIQEVIDSSRFINGPSVKEFVSNLSGYLGSKYTLGCGNGTDAIQIALMALDLEPGDEVITTPFTFVATIEVICLLGLKPVFVDIDPRTFNLDVSKIESAITSKTKVILPVHLYGQSTDMEPLVTIARKHNLYIIEDNAQSIGCEVKVDGAMHKTGTIGDFGTLSFFPSKNLGAFGDGGSVNCEDEELFQKATMIAKHGSKLKYYYDMVGINSRLDSIQAAILDVKLSNLDSYITSRRAAAVRYDELLQDVDALTLPWRAPYSSHVYHQYTMRVKENRDELKAYLIENKIPSMIYYPKALHLQPAYQYLGYGVGDFPVAERCCTEVLSLPMHTELDSDQLNHIGETIHSFYK